MTPPKEPLTCTYLYVNGRKETEALITNAARCKELGLDQMYEQMVYLKQYGRWLKDEKLLATDETIT